MSGPLNANQGRIKQIIAHSNRIANLEATIQHREHLIDEQRRFINEEKRKIQSEKAKRDNVEAELLALLADTPEADGVTEPAIVDPYATLSQADKDLGMRVNTLGADAVSSGWYVVYGRANTVFEVTDSGAARRHVRESGSVYVDHQWQNRSGFSAGPFRKIPKPEWVTA